ncbi:adenosylcobinamide amidohydrolase [Actinosynnema sp. NPDC047251]|uniref:adenosylcobinamide amidohydrolase n=1 Tax=Saccharothrix espanaensis TaxID=103731 RepID=UPI00031A39DE|nr:adenosylcobinamide amidohydrolase [Saccharothrix espanaensis]
MITLVPPGVLVQPDNGRPALVWSFPDGVRALSTAVVGGGLGPCRWVVNVEVDDQYHRDPVAHVAELAGAWGLTGPGAGLLTAAVVAESAAGTDRGVECVATVGLSHPAYAAASASAGAWTPGTINTVCWVPVGLSDGALVNAVVTATEAKAQALADAGVRGTGTPSDAIVVCCPEGGGEPYGGPRSLWGQRIANAVHQATSAGAQRWLIANTVTNRESGAFGLGLHHVQLAIPPGGEEPARAFYVGVLGMTEVPKPPVLAARGGVWVRADRLEIHLGVEDDFRPARKAHPGIAVADLDGLAARVAAAGVDVRWDGDFPGYRRCYVSDSFGNRLEFLSPDGSR